MLDINESGTNSEAKPTNTTPAKMPVTEEFTRSRFYSPLRRGTNRRGRDAEFASPAVAVATSKSPRRSPVSRTSYASSPGRRQGRSLESSLYPPLYVYATPDRTWRLKPSALSSLESSPCKNRDEPDEDLSPVELPFDEKRTTKPDPLEPERLKLTREYPSGTMAPRPPTEKPTVCDSSASHGLLDKPTTLPKTPPFTARKPQGSSPNNETTTTDLTTTRLADLINGDDDETITTVATGYRGDNDADGTDDGNHGPTVDENEQVEPENSPQIEPDDFSVSGDHPFDIKAKPSAQSKITAQKEPRSFINFSTLLSPSIGRAMSCLPGAIGDDANKNSKASGEKAKGNRVPPTANSASKGTDSNNVMSDVTGQAAAGGCLPGANGDDENKKRKAAGKKAKDNKGPSTLAQSASKGTDSTNVESNVGGQAATGGGGGEETPVIAHTSHTTAGGSSGPTTLREQIIPGQSKRTDFPLQASKTALLIIDIQEFLSRPSTEDEKDLYLYKTALPSVISNLQRLAGAMREKRATMSKGCNIVFTYLEALTADHRDVSIDYRLSGPLLAKGLPNSATAPAKFLVDLQPQKSEGDILIPKTSCNVFVSTNLHYVLQNLHVEQLIITGQLTDQCVESAVRDAADLGYLVTLVEDACAANSLDCHDKGLHGCKGFCRVMKTANVLQELAESHDGGLPPSPTTVATPTQVAKVDQTTTAENDIILPATDMDVAATTSKREVIESIHTALKVAGVKFLRFTTVDLYNTTRSKVVPLSRCSWDSLITIATVCFGGLPSFADMMIQESGLDAKGVLPLIPDYGTMRILPYSPKTAMILGTAVTTSDTATPSPLCTRGLLQRLVQSAKKQHGIAFNVGAELEFCLHDEASGLAVDQSVFANTTTLNQREDFLSDLMDQLEHQAIPIELLHAESGPGQIELVIEYSADPVKLADHILFARETVQACARAHGYRALFLPKIHADKAGNGCHLHLSFGTNHNENAFPSRRDPNSISPEGQSFLEGILEHLPALTAVTIPSENSFRRVGKGCWTGYEVGWDVEDKEVPLRVCWDIKRKALTNVELKLCDSMANMYVALACIFACGLDGILRQASLRSPSSSSAMEGAHATTEVPRTFDEALDKLADDEFLTKKVLGTKVSQAYLAIRREEAKRAKPMSLEQQVAEAWDKA